MEHAPLLADEGVHIAEYTTEPVHLRKSGTASASGDNESNVENELEKLTPLEEAKMVGKGALPLMLAFFLQYFLSIAPMFILGHVGATELAGASLAIMTYNITGTGVIQGMVTVMDTFASQAYGAQQYLRVGEVWQKCSMQIFIALLPFYGVWYWAEPILNSLQPDPLLSKLAQDYLRVVSWGTPGLMLFETGKRYLQAQKIFDAPTYVLLFVTPFSLSLTYYLVLPAGWGFIGAPIVVSLTYWLMALLLLAYIFVIDGYKCWGGFSYSALFTDFGPMLKLAVPGVIQTEAEYLAFEVMTLASAYFGTVALASQSICTSVGSLVFQIPFALSCAITTHIAQLIGAGAKTSSIRSTNLAMLGSLVVGSFSTVVLLILEKPIIRIFTEDEEVIKVTTTVLRLLFINQTYDSVNITMAGILRAQGEQRIGSILNIGSYYFFALPLAYILAFVLKMEVLGLWIAMSAGVVALTVVEFVVILRSDWNSIIEEARTRTRNEDFSH
ncbi:unnamed protein product [Kuraishia capsulata CBS 1993]|uniref:MATE efflux family protein n=1 Tax=Kuraishia capsulata CBS 1993 TaxID=1382522 RepID=W6MMT2_9ASCO|nr:uncharacterized protein KUCA_T00002268001 [Kuraishia capsulata CBS 1993]CDK26297.1 unnamed protein product [Kuraishia capsulata CBS 1993]